MFSKFLNVTPKVTLLPDYDMKAGTALYGVKALKYEGASYKGKKTEIFAYYGYPENAKSEKVPAVVLVHGGGGRAFAKWVKLWNDNGFAAIAMDLRGNIPNAENKGIYTIDEPGDDTCEKMPAYDNYIPTPEGYCVYDENEKITDLWFYQAITNVILAHNILLSDNKIDTSKIGICGISWGAITTSQVIAYDKRFAFAVPIYGSAHLSFSLSEVCKPFRNPTTARLWNVGNKYDDITFPILWLCWNFDHCFDVMPNTLSYLQTKKSDSVLAIRSNVDHSHVDAWSMQESYRFAKEVVQGNHTFVKPITEPVGFGELSFEITSSENVTATLYYLTEPMTYTEDSKPNYTWNTIPCTIDGNTVKVTVPSDADNYYIEFCQEKDGRKYTTSTSYIYNNY